MRLSDVEQQKNSQKSSCPRESPPSPWAHWPKIVTTAFSEHWDFCEVAAEGGRQDRSRDNACITPHSPGLLLRDGACSDAKAEPTEHVKMIGAGLSSPSLAFSSVV